MQPLGHVGRGIISAGYFLTLPEPDYSAVRYALVVLILLAAGGMVML